jgi:hypothetical protein
LSTEDGEVGESEEEIYFYAESSLGGRENNNYSGKCKCYYGRRASFLLKPEY